MSLLNHLLFPPKCAACGTLLDFTKLEEQIALCEDCAMLFATEARDRCGRCFQEVSACTCMTELLEDVGCKGLCKIVFYRHGKNSAIQNKILFCIKNKRDARTVRFLSAELAKIVRMHVFAGAVSLENAIVTYIPRRRGAVLEKGTDQARELAKGVSRELELPFAVCLSRRHGNQQEQNTLSPKERMKNARSAFSVSNAKKVWGKTVLLVDDIVTTGASMAAGAQKLLRAGAETVFCVSVSSDDTNQTPNAPLLKKIGSAH